MPGIDPAASKSKRIRRNWGAAIKGGVTTTLSVQQPVTINGTGELTLNIAGAGGLNAVGSSLSIKLDTNCGLVVSSNGLKILLVSGTALTLSASGLSVATDGATLETASNALRIKDAGVVATKLGVLTTKGDIIVWGSAHTRLPVGSDGQQIFADSSQATGLRWGRLPAGTATLVGGTIVVSDARVTASTIILLTIQNPNLGTIGTLVVSARSAGVSFTVLSSSPLDTSLVGYVLFEP